MSVLSDILPEGNKVPANTDRVKKLIRPVVMKVWKFDACPNHCILYRESSMRSWRAVHTVALVDIRGMPVVTWTQAMKDPRAVGQTRRR
jgi:hypothetical protein